MQVFVSWSGAHSQAVAVGLAAMLRSLDSGFQPWISSVDISSGRRWWDEVHGALAQAQFGVLCVGRNTLRSLWVMFEAGAMSMAMPDSRLCPLLIGVAPSELPGPLQGFQSRMADEAGIWTLVLDMHRLEPTLPDERTLQRRFKRSWPTLMRQIAEAPADLPNSLDPTDYNRLDSQGVERLIQIHFTASARRLQQVVAEALTRAGGRVDAVNFDYLALAAENKLNQGRLLLEPFHSDATGPLSSFLAKVFPVEELRPRLADGIARAKQCRDASEVMQIVEEIIVHEQTLLEQRLRQRLHARPQSV